LNTKSAVGSQIIFGLEIRSSKIINKKINTNKIVIIDPKKCYFIKFKIHVWVLCKMVPTRERGYKKITAPPPFRSEQTVRYAADDDDDISLTRPKILSRKNGVSILSYRHIQQRNYNIRK